MSVPITVNLQLKDNVRLSFLKIFYESLQEFYESLPDENKSALMDSDFQWRYNTAIDHVKEFIDERLASIKSEIENG